jgi:uncharacterized protein YprB with RNaseH-like and TPR domain
MVYQRKTTVALTGRKRGRLPLSGGKPFESRLLGRPTTLDQLVFIDTETTGLSGGAGTTVFLVGTGTYDGKTVTVTQTLLSDFPGEPDFLNVISRNLTGERTWVSYNGKAFDSRLLEARFLMNGMPFSLPEQLDLLYWSRRLWRTRLSDCSLGTVEDSVLGVHRNNDIPGVEIPVRYFSFLRSGDGHGLEDVFRHHVQDIVSLVLLFSRLEATLDDPLSAREIDRLQLGRWLLAAGLPGGEEVLRAVLDKPEPDEESETRAHAALLLGSQRRRFGDLDGAREAWRAAEKLGSPEAAVELAKLYEHKLGDPAAAWAVIEKLLERVPTLCDDPAIRRRLERLQGKITEPGRRRRPTRS